VLSPESEKEAAIHAKREMTAAVLIISLSFVFVFVAIALVGMVLVKAMELLRRRLLVWHQETQSE